MYELRIHRGSGYNGANWVLSIVVPHHGTPEGKSIILKTFRTYEKAVEGYNQLLLDLDQLDDLSSERR